MEDQTTALARRDEQEIVARGLSMNREQMDLLKRTVCRGATDDEFALFCHVAKRAGLDPFARQIHAVKRREKDEDGNWRDAITIQTGIDGYRLVAQRTGRYLGQRAAEWCGEDGEWLQVWLGEKPPAAARVGVIVKGSDEPTVGVALYREYVQRKKDGTPNRMWATMPAAMLAKCAEALALRKAFPQELAGIYSDAEMEQAEPESQDAPRVAMPKRASVPPPSEAAAALKVEAPDGAEKIVGVIAAISKKPTKTGGMRWGLKIAPSDDPERETWIGTFDENLATVAETLKANGEAVIVWYAKDGQFLNLVDISPLPI